MYWLAMFYDDYCWHQRKLMKTINFRKPNIPGLFFQVWRKYEVKKNFLRLQVDRIFQTVRWGVWPILAQNIEMKVRWIQRCQQKECCNHKKRNCIIIKWSNVLKQCTILLGIMAPCKLKKSLSTVEVWWQFYSLNETAGSKIKVIVVNSLFFKN
jgi:hypothetical protein